MMARPGPFFSYYGSKWRLSKHYQPPQYQTIIEPFAGSACYSLRYSTRQVILVDLYQPLVEVWRYLMRATPQDILSLPILAPGDNVHDCGLEAGARDLIGYNLNQSQAYPARQLSKWAREDDIWWRRRAKFWGPPLRKRIARQINAIKHWQIIEGDYRKAPDIEATWFIDPPYHFSGRHYHHSALDYEELAEWCLSRKGQVIVCEQEGATWLPFQAFANDVNGIGGKTCEVVWCSRPETDPQQSLEL